jgi:hypothetical protein
VVGGAEGGPGCGVEPTCQMLQKHRDRYTGLR